MSTEEDAINHAGLLARRMVWDIVPCPEENIVAFFPKMNLSPGSDEGNVVEHRASHRRLNELTPVLKEIVQTSEVAGAVLGRVLVDQVPHTEEEAEAKVQESVQVARAACIATIANLVDYGYLHLPHKAVLIHG